MNILDGLFKRVGKDLTADMKQGAQKSLDRVAIIAGSAVALAVLLGLLAVYFGFHK